MRKLPVFDAISESLKTDLKIARVSCREEIDLQVYFFENVLVHNLRSPWLFRPYSTSHRIGPEGLGEDPNGRESGSRVSVFKWIIKGRRIPQMGWYRLQVARQWTLSRIRCLWGWRHRRVLRGEWSGTKIVRSGRTWRRNQPVRQYLPSISGTNPSLPSHPFRPMSCLVSSQSHPILTFLVRQCL